MGQAGEIIQEHQANHYANEYDYLKGSPHLRHRHLNATLIGWIARTFDGSKGPEGTVLEIGAGDGSLTEPLLAMGYRVVATEMSEASAERLKARFGGNDRFEAIYDPHGDFSAVEGRRFDALLFASVLHHIPDYLGTISHLLENHLVADGALVSIQDPLWYPRLPRPVRLASDTSFLSWRLTQGHLLRGLRTRLRRFGTGPGEEEPGDVVEYHVVRDGVNEQAIAGLLATSFQNVQIRTYWSTQGPVQQRLGESAGLRNTFAILASGYIG